MIRRKVVGLTLLCSVAVGSFADSSLNAEMISFTTNVGTFVVQTYDDTPVAVNNIKQYIEQDLLLDSFIHLAANIPLVGGGSGTILWGGQYTIDLGTGVVGQVNTLAPVGEPSQATHSNVKYTITMAQTNAKQYTSGWFINMTDNTGLDGEQFTAWGEVVEGRDVLDAILNMDNADLSSVLGSGFANVPFDDVSGEGGVNASELIRLTAVSIPEPASLTMLVIGSLAILGRRTV